MLSYRAQLAKIGIPAEAAVSYRQFYSRPQSLLEAMRSMDAPAHGDWEQVSETRRDERWTDEVQGVAWNGSYWIFSTNANRKKWFSREKALYVFPPDADLREHSWVTRLKYKDVPLPFESLSESDSHWGQITYYKGHLYVAHVWEGGPRKGWANVFIFESSGATLAYKDWVELEKPKDANGNPQKAEFQGINPWDGLFYSSFAASELYTFFKHDPENGKLTGETLPVQEPFGGIQGACFTPNGHLYIASDRLYEGDERFHSIPYYSALNGYRFGVIRVDVQDIFKAEVEGICYAPIDFGDGRKAQIHTPVLENPTFSLDHIYFKRFSTSTPDIV